VLFSLALSFTPGPGYLLFEETEPGYRPSRLCGNSYFVIPGKRSATRNPVLLKDSGFPPPDFSRAGFAGMTAFDHSDTTSFAGMTRIAAQSGIAPYSVIANEVKQSHEHLIFEEIATSLRSSR
jgi:hypothetical protein